MDPRAERTRRILIEAFNGLLLSRGYDAVTPASIASAAGVARSTFYAHFSSKPLMLKHVLRPVLLPLAETVCEESDSDELGRVLEHFWSHRHIARSIMTGRPRIILQNRLAELIESRLRRSRYDLRVPLPLAAASVAHAQIAMLDSWLTRGGLPTALTVATAMRAVASATVIALRA